MESDFKILSQPEKIEIFEIRPGGKEILNSTTDCDLGFCFMNRDFKFNSEKFPPSFKLYSQMRNSQTALFQGIQFKARKKKSIYYKKNAVGILVSDDDTEQIFVFGLTPMNTDDPATLQAEKLFVLMKIILEENDFRFTDLVRTWFYNKDILSWYSDFNKIRTNFYRENGIGNFLPASTGIGADNIDAAAISCGFHALKRKDGRKVAELVESPLQCSAERYKSSFSRAVELNFQTYKKLNISGTASINKNGETIHIGNCSAQIAETMRVVNAILQAKNISWENIIRAIAYFSNYEDITLFRNFIRENKIFPFPYVAVETVICRENLLFEIEADAIILK